MESHRELSASLLVIFLVAVWSLWGPLCKLWSIQSGDWSWRQVRQSELAFHLEDPAAPYIAGQSWCYLYEGLNFIISGMRACLLCCNSAGMSAFTSFCQPPNYSPLPQGSRTSSPITQHDSSPIFHPVALTYKPSPSGVSRLWKRQCGGWREAFGISQPWFWLEDMQLALCWTSGELPDTRKPLFPFLKRNSVLSTL